MDSVRQRRREDAAATRDRITEIRRRMKAGETWQARANRLLAVLYPLLLLAAVGLGVYCGYQYYHSRPGLETGEGPRPAQDILEERGDALGEEAVEEIIAEE
jgi:hypothetical protein